MRKIFLVITGLWLCGLFATVHADTFLLTDGTSLTGDIVTFNDFGVIIRTSDDKYTDRTPWTKFSQETLKQLSAANPKIEPLVEPFIEIPASQRPPKPAINVQPVTRLESPEKQSLLGALFSSSVGVFVLLLIYGANIYAGFEVAIFRFRPLGMGIGMAAVLPVVGPIILLSMPMASQAEAAPAEQVIEPAVQQTFSVPGQKSPVPEEVQIAHSSWQQPETQQPSAPPAQVFQRGQFTFNRRFFETKFPGFFGVVRRDIDKDMMMIVKTMRGEFVVQHIVRITQDDVHFQIVKDEASHEELVPFVEIQEIQLKHKDA